MRVWRLKTDTWKEVRPFEWPKLPDQERITLARTGRQKLNSLGITPADPLWEHFVYRSPANPVAEASTSKANDTKSGTQVDPPPKRGVLSRELKEKKAKPKANSNAEIHMKDEGSKATLSSNINGKAKEIDAASERGTRPGATGRKLPGSGFKLGKGRESSEDANHSPTIHDKPVDVRTGPSASLPPKPPPANPSSIKHEKKIAPPPRIRKIRESDVISAGTDSDREKSLNRSKETGKGRLGKEQFDEERRRPSGKETTTLKRKQASHDEDDSETALSKPTPQKKRKLETTAATTAALPSEDAKSRDLSLPKKPEVGPPRIKIKREPSPLPPPSPLPKFKKELPSITSVSEPTRHARDASSSAQTHGRDELSKANGTSKSRRKSPVYTSSEDEGEIRQPKRDNLSAPSPPSPLVNRNRTLAVQSSLHPRSRATREQKSSSSLPTDRTTLRARYKSTYGEYLVVFQKVWTQREKIQGLLEHGDGYGSTTESDGGELMDSEDLNRLSSDYQRLHDELMTMRSVFEKGSD